MANPTITLQRDGVFQLGPPLGGCLVAGKIGGTGPSDGTMSPGNAALPFVMTVALP
jgi:hypothetical protein